MLIGAGLLAVYLAGAVFTADRGQLAKGLVIWALWFAVAIAAVVHLSGRGPAFYRRALAAFIAGFCVERAVRRRAVRARHALRREPRPLPDRPVLPRLGVVRPEPLRHGGRDAAGRHRDPRAGLPHHGADERPEPHRRDARDPDRDRAGARHRGGAQAGAGAGLPRGRPDRGAGAVAVAVGPRRAGGRAAVPRRHAAHAARARAARLAGAGGAGGGRRGDPDAARLLARGALEAPQPRHAGLVHPHEDLRHDPRRAGRPPAVRPRPEHVRAVLRGGLGPGRVRAALAVRAGADRDGAARSGRRR